MCRIMHYFTSFYVFAHLFMYYFTSFYVLSHSLYETMKMNRVDKDCFPLIKLCIYCIDQILMFKETTRKGFKQCVKFSLYVC